ncbi:MFS transporter [Clavibacter nebraskensis]|uniref:MFS transporter n=1 Tax=Clavibacter nebraskensis TaxID=31963 RepID=UPI003F825627
MTTPTPPDRRAIAGVGLAFASNGAIFASLLPWYPLLAERLDLGPAAFGLVVACFAVGSIASSAAPAPLLARFGPVPVAVVGTALVGVAVASAAWSGAGWMLAVALLAAGFLDAVVDVAQNVAGIRVQDAAGRSILSSMHALWSLGAVAGGAVSTVAAAAGADVRLHLALSGVACLALVAVGGRLIGPAARAPGTPSAADADASASASATVPASDARRRGRLRRVLAVSLPLVAVAICGTMVEDVANNWAALSAVRIGGLPADVAGLAFIVVIGSQCVGRFSGDALIQRSGRAAVARLGGALIAVGGILVVTTHGQVATLLLGLALAGYGSATLVPSAMSAAAEIPGVSAGAGVTLVSWLMRLGFLVTSPLIGGLTEAVDLRLGLGLVVVVGAAAALLAGALGGRGPRTVDA